ncbi:MAG: hypothetical protein IPH52_16190 [Leptospiraceae bacterium]|nr:hypothetical protein [Leptospiraceae bacterium]
MTTIAGSGVAASTDGIGLVAEFNEPHGIEKQTENLFITEYTGQKIRRVKISSFDVVTIAGLMATRTEQEHLHFLEI